MGWEYYTHAVDISGFFSTGAFDPQYLTNALNWYGQQGWELVSTFAPTAGGHWGSTRIALVFKRPLQAAPAVAPVGSAAAPA